MDRELNRLWGWVDTDFAADFDTRCSHTGYVIMNGRPISWKSVNQKSVSLSTAESEWYASSEAGKELLSLVSSCVNLDSSTGDYANEDSRAVIAMAENPSNQGDTTH
jgi:hypothetical protein